MQHYAKEYKRNVKSFSEDALGAIKGHRWPGNIRELQNKVKSSVIMTTGTQVTAIDLGFFDHQDKSFRAFTKFESLCANKLNQLPFKKPMH